MDDLKTLQQVRREHIRQVLESTGGKLESASRILGIKPAALKRLIRELGLEEPASPRELGP